MIGIDGKIQISIDGGCYAQIKFLAARSNKFQKRRLSKGKS